MAYHMAHLEKNGLIQHPFHVADQMGGDQNGAVFVVVGQNRIHNEIPGRRVHTGNGFIQQIQLGLAAHDQCQLQFLLGALGHGFNPVLRLDFQAAAHVLGLGPVEIRVEISEKVRQVLGLHPVGKVHPVRQIADLALGVGAGLLAVNEQLAAGGLQQTAQQLDERCLAGTVGAQQSHNASPANGQIDLIQGGQLAVILDQIPAYNQILFHVSSSSHVCSSSAASARVNPNRAI